MEIPIISYYGTRNIGDAIQTVALEKILRSLDRKTRFKYVRRDHLSAYYDSSILVNGYHRSAEERGHPPCHFIGVHMDPCMEPWLWKTSTLIGARDPWTMDWMRSKGMNADLTGCATMAAFERHTGTRYGDYRIDVEGESGGITCNITEEMPWNAQHAVAGGLLHLLRTASSVVTSRLHIALPCVAFGTPVELQRTGGEPERYTIADEIGLVEGSFVSSIDLSPWKERFMKLLKYQLQFMQ